MKRLICAVLIFLMLPITCLTLAGCGKDDYNVKNFYSSYKNIANNITYLSLKPVEDTYQVNNNSHKIDIDYTKSSALSTLVDAEGSQYHHLKHFYQQLLDDSLSPLYLFGEAISDSKKVNEKQAKQLFNGLSELEQEYKDIDHWLGILMNSLNNSEATTINLFYLKNVFNEYEQAITTANRFSITVCDVYFNTVLSNPNYNYSNKHAEQLTEADLTRISIDVRTRITYYKSVYANVYNQSFVRGNNWAETLSSLTNVTLPNYAPYNSLKTITRLTNQSMASWKVNQKTIHTNAVALYNVQNSFDKAYSNFVTATNHVTYSKLDSNSSSDAKNYGKIITQFNSGIAIDSYEILNKLITLLYSYS